VSFRFVPELTTVGCTSKKMTVVVLTPSSLARECRTFRNVITVTAAALGAYTLWVCTYSLSFHTSACVLVMVMCALYMYNAYEYAEYQHVVENLICVANALDRVDSHRHDVGAHQHYVQRTSTVTKYTYTLVVLFSVVWDTEQHIVDMVVWCALNYSMYWWSCATERTVKTQCPYWGWSDMVLMEVGLYAKE